MPAVTETDGADHGRTAPRSAVAPALRLVFQAPASMTLVVDALRLVSSDASPDPSGVGGHVLDAGGADRSTEP